MELLIEARDNGKVTMVDLSAGDQDRPTFSHLAHLRLELIDEITTPHLLISSDHLNALSDIIHARMKRNDISIVNTAFFREMLQVKDNNYEQAQRYIQPDKKIKNQWKKPSARIKVTASSTVLLIPCHLERAMTDKIRKKGRTVRWKVCWEIPPL